jgi:hypothetical protein
MMNLNELIGDATKEYRLDSATAINDKGQIVATAFVRSAGNYHAVLLTPTGEDASMAELDRAILPIKVTHATYSVTSGMLTVYVTYAGGVGGTMPPIPQPVLRVFEGGTKNLIGMLQTKNGSDYFGSFGLKSNPYKIWVLDNYGKRADAEVVEVK